MSVDLNQLATRVKRPYPELFHLSFNGELEGTWSPKSPDGDYDGGGFRLRQRHIDLLGHYRL
jgi:hypothetical protein